MDQACPATGAPPTPRASRRSSATAQAAAPPVHASRSDDPTVAAVGEPPTTSPSPAVEDASSPSFAEPGAVWFVPAVRGARGDAGADDREESNAPFRVVTVLDEHARNYHPRVSPDGRLIAFDSDRDGDRGVYVADRDGTHVRRVSGDGFAALPSWSPDGKSLAFVRGEPGDPGVWNLWLRDMASGGMNQLTTYRVGRTSSASWFPNGRRLCYGHRDQLVLLDVTTGTTETIASPRAGQAIGTPTVSPEGRRIIFRVGSDGVWIIDLQSRATRRILDDPTAEEFAWNPGGSQVAYHSRKDGQWRIWVTAPPPS
jgi:Tol biopolymer transport system component